MHVTVRLSEPLRSLAGNREIVLSLPANTAGLSDVVAELLRSRPELAADLDRPAEALDANYTVFHNGKVVHFADRADVGFQDRDELSIFLPMAGGAV